jgi:hypothetical protein
MSFLMFTSVLVVETMRFRSMVLSRSRSGETRDWRLEAMSLSMSLLLSLCLILT